MPSKLCTDLIGRIIQFIPMDKYLGYDHEAAKEYGGVGRMGFNESSAFWGKVKHNFETASRIIRVLCPAKFAPHPLDDRHLKFGKFRKRTYQYVRDKCISYCVWVKGQENAGGQLLGFKNYLTGVKEEKGSLDFDCE